MSTTPGLYGNFLYGPPPFFSAMPAISTPSGTWIKPGGRIAAYLRSTGVADGDEQFTNSAPLVTTLNAACAYCRSGKDDIIYVLPGHDEDISSADQISNLVAGTQIISAGRPGSSNNPTFTWTATSSTFLLDVADVTLRGLTLDFSGIDNVAAPITVSAAGCSIVGCQIQLQNAAGSAGAVQGIALASGANDFAAIGNVLLSDDEGEPLSGGGAFAVGAAVDNCLIAGNYICGASPGDTVGLIDVTAAATNLRILDNVLIQLETTNALNALIIDSVAATGCAGRNFIKIGEANDVDPRGILVGANAATTFLVFENYAIDNLVSASAILSPAADTVT